MSLVMIVPTRGRPDNMRELYEAWSQPGVTELESTKLLFVVDSDDPELPKYNLAYESFDPSNTLLMVFTASHPANGRLAEILNAVATTITPDQIGFMGDDHRPRTPGWDRKFSDSLHELKTGIVYGDDKIQGRNLPTAVAMTSNIPLRLGYMVPPSLKHMFLDNFWRDIGIAIDRLRYLPDVVIEHMHPIAGKSPWDIGYAEVGIHMEEDSSAYAEYIRTRFALDVAKLKDLIR